MAKTKSLRTVSVRKTRKCRSLLPSFTKVTRGKIYYGAKPYSTEDLLKYNEDNRTPMCNMKTISWFSSKNIASKYLSEKRVYLNKFVASAGCRLLNLSLKNEKFINCIFEAFEGKLSDPFAFVQPSGILFDYKHSYTNLTNNQKALYAFKFVFGFHSVSEQSSFMNYLITTGGFHFLKYTPRVLKQLNINSNEDKMNPFSDYESNLICLYNLCKCLKQSGYDDVEGVSIRATGLMWKTIFYNQQSTKTIAVWNAHEVFGTVS